MSTANAQGSMKGSFTIPENKIPAGATVVRFDGTNGSRGEAIYTGSGEVQTRTLRRIHQISTELYDPLAQTFTLSESRHISSVDIYFTAIGEKNVRVQIRETASGVPSKEVLAEKILPVEALKKGRYTKFQFQPVFLNAGQEYAIVVLTDDANHAVGIAEIGKFDKSQRNDGYIAQQPYQVGVLLSSSNTNTWTAHQKKDLTFKLNAAKFQPNDQQDASNPDRILREVAFSPIQVEDVNGIDHVTDIMVMAAIDRPGTDTDVQFIVQLGHTELTLQAGQNLELKQPFNGTIKVVAQLKGSAVHSPVLYPGTQLILGQLKSNAAYITRAIPVSDEAQITFKANTPGSAHVDVEIQDQTGNWTSLTRESSTDLHSTYKANVKPMDNTRLKLTLKGDTASRPFVEDLRLISYKKN